ncbi:uncharacterized protein PHACADRAFT_211543 [Phanerochaete carnosa HHB-10118-sp]|uniref:DUF6533 domain-containing protein n=1 Tax=Phanerochaete carnosa (strain HHB-10118-sp) TaxID=650164 RepID=K5UR02_PHACS|nr:uncharacterized protein PHACADRAFT_211543 [Phanerochaete carnosa HHB-10118-sp]EKM52271.1 hypothetical protein PHACADRAFT_211543 [Phanerochaete carnosa HHB-10118-sp]
MDKTVSSDTITATARHQVVRYTAVVSMTVLVTDWMYLFSEELEHIWSRKWSFAEFLYLFTRYMPFIDVSISLVYYLSPTISPETCLVNYATGTWLLVVGFAIAELILVWRTYAIWQKSKKIMWTVGIVWTIVVLANIPILTIFTRSLNFGPQPLPQIPGCNLVNASDIAFGSFFSVLLMEIVVVTLTVYKGVQDVRRSSSALVLIMYRDGVLYFVCLLVMSLGNVLVILAAPVEYFDLLINLTRVLHAILCCRVILHLRQAAQLDGAQTSSQSSSQLSTIRFKIQSRLRRQPPMEDSMEMTDYTDRVNDV